MADNIYKAPDSTLGDIGQAYEYAGFWIRVGAALIDTILMAVIIFPILSMIYGTEYWGNSAIVIGTWDFLLNYVFPAIAVILFWVYKSATPGKMLFGIKIVDEKSGGKLATWQLIVRYLGYYVSAIPLCLGLIWVGIDKRKQGWHDKIAGTLVVKN